MKARQFAMLFVGFMLAFYLVDAGVKFAMNCVVKSPLGDLTPQQVQHDLIGRVVQYGQKQWLFEPDEATSVEILGKASNGESEAIVQVRVRSVGNREAICGMCLLQYFRVADIWLLGGIFDVSLALENGR